MFERLFQRPTTLARHREGPLAQAREKFLAHCAEQGAAHNTLLRLASDLLIISKRLHIPTSGVITLQQIETAAHRWRRYQRRRGRVSSSKARIRFVQVASVWLRFLGRLEPHEPGCFVGMDLMLQFMAYMRDERGYSPHTIRTQRYSIERFLKAFNAQNRPFSEVCIEDIDSFLESLGKQNWCRSSIASSARVLRSFFRYAGENGWCGSNIAAGIMGPRVFEQEGLPLGVSWNDIEQLIHGTCGNTPSDIRANAILRLLVSYGLRRREVTSLCLDHINWGQDRISVPRPKQRCAQEYPLLPSVGDAILRYLQEVRPRSRYREVFLTLHAPIQPLSADGLTEMVRARLLALGICSPHYGPHALRHACANRMVSQELSLKEIGDHLGHRCASSTRIYAKVDIAGLRNVAEFSLGGLL